ncbi:Tethering factor for nuclear proteasome STS1 [Ceratocystis lukuohia]|uniref:Tethering factor for nuclear proteasome STS1 n=1 Tax=Ceratocystis lukuohia TaxID=2019550 RepID=A0ABR4MLQ6_9PEZI
MSAVLPPHNVVFPHNHEAPRRSPQRSMSPFNMSTSTSRKRKADDDDEMTISPSASPAISQRQILRPQKRNRQSELVGRQLSMPRLLETLDPAQLRTVLGQICQHHPEIGHQVAMSAPRPTVSSVLGLLDEYMGRLKDAMPYGNSSPDYTYNRVKQPLIALIDALADFTMQFLPPVESQVSASLQFLDGATKIIHSLPNWESPSYTHHKDTAYDEIAKAWALVFNEASSRGAGFQLSTGGWEQTINRHNSQSGGRLASAVTAMQGAANWSTPNNSVNDASCIRNQIMSGTYGLPSVRVGPW